MRKLTLLLLALFGTLTLAPSPATKAPQSVTVEIPSIPKTAEEFIALRDKIATTPEGGVVMYLLAAHLYGTDHKLGLQAFTVALDTKNLMKGDGGVKGWIPNRSFSMKLKYLDEMPWAGATYVSGTDVKDTYKLPALPWKYEILRNAYSEQSGGALRLLAKTSGADMPRPYTVRKNDQGILETLGQRIQLVYGNEKTQEDRSEGRNLTTDGNSRF